MGSSQSSRTSLQVDPASFFAADLPKFVNSSRIGNGKCLKTFLMKLNGSPAAVKVYMRSSSDEDLTYIVEKLSFMWKTISPALYPNLLPYQCWIKSSSRNRNLPSPVYLIRQYFAFNLYDRLATRPFLFTEEKIWIIFQLLKGIEMCHSKGIIHGDIKPENIMCTSFNWVVITDFACHKPTFIPDDDTADFLYFFDAVGRRRCYVAPERFRKRQTDDASGVDKDSSSSSSRVAPVPSMDIFSLGCTIAEIFLGQPLLDLPSLLQYVTQSSSKFESLDHEDSPVRSILLRVENKQILKAIINMTLKDPQKRLSVSEYISYLEGVRDTKDSDSGTYVDPEKVVFPSYFSTILFPLFTKLHFEGRTPDERIKLVCKSYEDIMISIVKKKDEFGQLFLKNLISSITLPLETELTPEQSARAEKIKKNAMECAKCVTSTDSDISTSSIDDPLSDLVKKCQEFLLRVDRSLFGSQNDINSTGEFDDDFNEDSISKDKIENTFFDLLNPSAEVELSSALQFSRPTFDFLIILIQVIVSNIRYLKHTQTKVASLLLLVRFGVYSSDEVILHRIIPAVLSLIEGNSAFVRTVAVRCLRALTCVAATSSTSHDSSIFPNYIFPIITKMTRDPDISVRLAVAESIGRFAWAARKFLDRAHLHTLNRSLFQHQTKEKEKDTSEKDGDTGSELEFSDSSVASSISSWTSLSKSSVSDADLVKFTFDGKLRTLREQVSRWIRDLVIEGSFGSGNNFFSNSEYRRGSGLSSHGSLVKRALLSDVIRLCEFFGQESTSDMLLTQLLTFLNDQDWELRYAFCEKIPSVCAFVGRVTTSECILPCIEIAINDVEERVVACAITCLKTLIELGLLCRTLLSELQSKILPLLLHPFSAVRSSTIEFIVSYSRFLGPVDTRVFLKESLQPFLKAPLNGIEDHLHQLDVLLLPPVHRRTFRKALLSKVNPGETQNGSVEYSSVSISSESLPSSQYSTGARTPTTPLSSNSLAGSSTLVNISNESLSSRLGELGSILLDEDEQELCKELPEELSPQENRDEERKLQLMESYLVYASKEMSTKIIQWRNAVTSGNSVDGNVVTLRRASNPKDPFVSTNLDSILDITSSSMPEQSIHSLGVPHQKLDSLYCAFLPEEERSQFLEGKLKPNSLKGLRRFYGIPDLDKQNSINEDHSRSKTMTMEAAWEYNALSRRIRALNIPPLPPDVGALVQPDDRKYNSYNEQLIFNAISSDGPNRSAWRPKEGVLAGSLLEHKGSVNKLAVSPDQTFFVSVSSDRTAKVWQIRGMDRVAYPRSALTYKEHQGCIIDCVALENSHSIASASDDGRVHIWRVDLASQSSHGTMGYSGTDYGGFSENGISAPSTPNDFQRVSGLSVSKFSQIRTLDASEGAVVSVQHFNNDISSLVMYATQGGKIHGWDLRCAKESFVYDINPELGFPTCMTLSTDRHWVSVGTDQGYIPLWDLRYNTLCKLWRHSSNSAIHRLACCKAVPISTTQAQIGSNSSVSRSSQRDWMVSPSEGAYLIVSAGYQNEIGVWGIPEGGDCLKCFRTILRNNRSQLGQLPTLNEISLPSSVHTPIIAAFGSRGGRSNISPLGNNGHSIRSVLGRISTSATGSYLITGGTDRHIRFWDFVSPERCCTVAGLEASQPAPTYESPLDEKFQGKLVVCYDAEIPTAETIQQAYIPIRDGRGPLPPECNFQDAIMDLKIIDMPLRLLLSSGRDGSIRLWR